MRVKKAGLNFDVCKRNALGKLDKSPKGSANSLRRKGSRKLTSGDQGEPIDELENIGFTDEPEISLLFETSGNVIIITVWLIFRDKKCCLVLRILLISLFDLIYLLE